MNNKIQLAWELAWGKKCLNNINADIIEWAENETLESVLAFAKSVGKTAYPVDNGEVILFAVNDSVLIEEIIKTIKVYA